MTHLSQCSTQSTAGQASPTYPSILCLQPLWYLGLSSTSAFAVLFSL